MRQQDEQSPVMARGGEQELWLLTDPRRMPVTRDGVGERPTGTTRTVRLAPQQLYHPGFPCMVLVRRGRLRLSEVLPDGREIARDVAQSGDVLRIVPGRPDRGRAFPLSRTILMALSESELQVLSTGVNEET